MRGARRSLGLGGVVILAAGCQLDVSGLGGGHTNSVRGDGAGGATSPDPAVDSAGTGGAPEPPPGTGGSGVGGASDPLPGVGGNPGTGGTGTGGTAPGTGGAGMGGAKVGGGTGGTGNTGVDSDCAPGLAVFAFSGTVATVAMAGPARKLVVEVGDRVSGHYCIDLTAPDGRGSPTFASYYFDNTPETFVLQLSVGGLSARTAELDPASFSSSVDVHDDDGIDPSGRWDGYDVIAREVVSAQLSADDLVQIALELATGDTTVLSSTSLPTPALDPLRFENTRQISISVFGRDPTEFISIRSSWDTLERLR